MITNIVDNKLGIHIDYLSFTFPIKYDPEKVSISDTSQKYIEQLAVMLGFDLGEILESPSKFNFYEYNFQLGEHVFCRYGGENTRFKESVFDDDGEEHIVECDSFQLEIKGAGCRDIESRGRVDYIELFDYIIYEHAGKCNRIDIAIDDLDGTIIDIPYIRNIIYNKKSYTSAWNLPPVPYGTPDSGLSLEFGRRTKSSTLELCIYDKLQERRYRKDNMCESLNYWTRYEMRFKKERANALTSYILDTKWEDFGEFARGQLYQMLDLKVPGDDSNLSRLPTDKKWLEFLGEVKKTKFTMLKKSSSNIAKKMTWRDYSMTRMNMIFELSGCYSDDNDLDVWINPSMARLYHELNEIVEYYKNKGINVQDLALINSYRAKKGKKILSKDDVFNYILELKKRAEWIKEKMVLPF